MRTGRNSALWLTGLLSALIVAMPSALAAGMDEPGWVGLPKQDITKVTGDSSTLFDAMERDQLKLTQKQVADLLVTALAIVNGTTGAVAQENFAKELLRQRAIFAVLWDKSLASPVGGPIGKDTTEEAVEKGITDTDLEDIDLILQDRPADNQAADSSKLCEAVVHGYDELVAGMAELGIVLTLGQTDAMGRLDRYGDKGEGLGEGGAERVANVAGKPLKTRMKEIIEHLQRVLVK